MTIDEAMDALSACPDKTMEIMMVVDGCLVPVTLGESFVEVDGETVDFMLAESEADCREIGNGVKFERIRRITGYLVGGLDRFNDAKRAEEHDRVKHIRFSALKN